MRYIIFSTFLLVACKEPYQAVQESKHENHRDEASASDQIMARVIAVPSEKGRFYMVTITNSGSVPFHVSGLVRQQWFKISSEGDSSWEEQTNRLAHSHENPTFALGDSFTRGVEPWTFSDMPLRFGFVTRVDENSRTLIVWSESVSPAKDWPKATK